MRSMAVMVLVLGGTACTRPPPAPEGLDEAARYLVREFYSPDAEFQAGVQGFMQWFDEEGRELVGLEASVDGSNGKAVDAFTVGDLRGEDVAALPLLADLAAGPPEDTTETTPRDIAAAAGVVSVAEMDCRWTEAEAYLVRPDQDVVFPDDWEAYTRRFVSGREAFEAGSAREDYAAVEEPVMPYAEGFDPEALASTFLFTENDADPTPLLGVDIPSYPLDFVGRHGRFELLDGSEVSALSILTFSRDAAWGDGGDNALRQSISIEIDIERPGDKTLRMLAVWAEPVSPILSADSAATLTYAVNRSQKASGRISAVCSGEESIEE